MRLKVVSRLKLGAERRGHTSRLAISDQSHQDLGRHQDVLTSENTLMKRERSAFDLTDPRFNDDDIIHPRGL